MTPDDEPFTERLLALLSGYLRPDLAQDETAKHLTEALRQVAGDLDPEPLAELVDDLAKAREDSSTSKAREALMALVARAFLGRAIAASAGELPGHAAYWMQYNVTAASRNARRIAAIWRIAAGLGQDDDQGFYDHALKSALAGETVKPVPGTSSTEAPSPGTEETMLDPTALRDKLLENMIFNPTGLPENLRTTEGQKVYIDAVVQGVLRQQHFADGDDDSALLWSASAAGLMLIDGHYKPTDQRFFTHLQRNIVELAGSADEDGQVEIDSHGLQMFAPDDDTQRIAIFDKTYRILNAGMGGKGQVFLQSFARVARKMADRYDDHKGENAVMAVMAVSAYAKDISDIGQAGGGGGGDGIANVELPPLSDPQGYNDEIEPENVVAVSTIYVTYQLEFALKALSRILELFVAGLLPIAASDGSARELDSLYWDQDDLLDEASRRSVYARVLGAAGGEIVFDVQPNTEFNTLLMRVVSAVSEYEREQSALTHFDNAARGRRFQSTSGEFVRKAVRDFAANASLRGWAGTAFTAERMAKHVERAFSILKLPSVRNAFGVTTPWQVVERVSQREFGVTVNTVLHRTLALETQTIMRIIADNHTVWSTNGGRPLFPDPGAKDADLTEGETRRLMVACQHFRAVTGVGDSLLEEYSSPVETAAMPSLPEISGFGGAPSGGTPGVDMTGINQLRDMVATGQAPSLEQLRSMLPGF